MQLLSKRWVGLIIYKLLTGPQRFSEVEHGLPITGKLLSERLKELESKGLVERKIYAEVPVRVEYALTEMGKAMEPSIRSIEQWASEWIK
jgi:DNA-binding HxlR family transcriptional regulator